MHCHTWLILYLLEMGFLHAGQACLELPTSGDPPASASQSAGITGVSHCTQQVLEFLNLHFLMCKMGQSAPGPTEFSFPLKLKA